MQEIVDWIERKALQFDHFSVWLYFASLHRCKTFAYYIINLSLAYANEKSIASFDNIVEWFKCHFFILRSKPSDLSTPVVELSIFFADHIKRYKPSAKFGDRRHGNTASARTYFYTNEAACEKNMETFLRCIEAVAGNLTIYQICILMFIVHLLR